ncbi:glycosyltransferase involved in cell wall biosynthesis [Bradyrhizobium sp. i1.15.2]|uniref:glycosyltransferase n=1 Tax=Bradyrhizobium sp. i1.15.2 TaxID=3156362 RepID=UPI00339ADC7A
MKPIRVCFLIQAMSDGGAQKQCIYLLNELARRDDVELHLLYFFPGVHDALLNREKIIIKQIPVRSNYDPLNILRLRRELEQVRPQVLLSWLHACDTYSFFLRWSMPSLRWIMTERNSFYVRDVRFWLRRHLGRYADAVIANSPQGDAYWQAANARGRRFVIPNIVQTPQVGAIDRSNTILHVGRLEPQKNVEVLIRAFCTLAKRRDDLSFLLVGDGSLRPTLEAVVRKEGVSSRVAFAGFRTDVARYIAAARALVSISHYEGLPNVLLEGVSAGAPIIASAIPEHVELLGSKYAYYVHDRSSPEECADTIELALRAADPTVDLEFALSKLSSMTPDKVAERYVDVFRSIAGGP